MHPARSVASVRLALAVAAAAAGAALGALIMGEYELAPTTAIFAALAFGFAIGEVIASISRRHGVVEAALAAVITGGGLAWGGWISSGRGLVPLTTAAKFAPFVGAVVAVLTVRSSAPRAGSSRPDSSPPAGGPDAR